MPEVCFSLMSWLSLETGSVHPLFTMVKGGLGSSAWETPFALEGWASPGIRRHIEMLRAGFDCIWGVKGMNGTLKCLYHPVCLSWALQAGSEAGAQSGLMWSQWEYHVFLHSFIHLIHIYCTSDVRCEVSQEVGFAAVSLTLTSQPNHLLTGQPCVMACLQDNCISAFPPFTQVSMLSPVEYVFSGKPKSFLQLGLGLWSFFSRTLLSSPRPTYFQRASEVSLLHPMSPDVSPLLQPIQGKPFPWLSSQSTWLLSLVVVSGLCIADIWAQS